MTTKSKTVFAFISIFLIGLASGYVLSDNPFSKSREYSEEQTERSHQWQRDRDESESGESREERIRKKIIEQLELTADQQDPFFEEILDYRQQIGNSMREMRSNEHEMVKEHYEAFRDELSEILDSGQVAKMDSVFHPDSVRQNRGRSERWGRD